MSDQIEIIRQSQEPFPLVFQHGDPGTWNILVTSEKHIAFLDWEAAEPEGIPLWDLFYFLRSFGVGIAKLNGVPDRLQGFEQQFLKNSDFSQLLIDASDTYCDAIGLPKKFVRPLFYTCWMHRALKESTRFNENELESGHYVNLLRLCIDRYPETPLDRHFINYTALNSN